MFEGYGGSCLHYTVSPFCATQIAHVCTLSCQLHEIGWFGSYETLSDPIRSGNAFKVASFLLCHGMLIVKTCGRDKCHSRLGIFTRLETSTAFAGVVPTQIMCPPGVQRQTFKASEMKNANSPFDLPFLSVGRNTLVP